MNLKVIKVLFIFIVFIFSCDESIVIVEDGKDQENLYSETTRESLSPEQPLLKENRNDINPDEKKQEERDGGGIDIQEYYVDKSLDLENFTETTKEELHENDNELLRRIKNCLFIEISCTGENACTQKSIYFYEINLARTRVSATISSSNDPFCLFKTHQWKLDAPVGSIASISNYSGTNTTFVTDVEGSYSLWITSAHQSGFTVKEEIKFLR